MRPAIMLAVVAVVVTALSFLLVPRRAAAQDPSPFDRPLAIGGYATGHAGSYLAGGVGGRLRWEPLSWLGLETYLEATLVDWDGGFRHDYPNGFNAFIPIRLGSSFRVRPYFGFCDILSFAEPAEQGAPRADDILLGAHLGVGGEMAVHRLWSAFVDVQFNGYAGHDRTSRAWTGGVDEELDFFWNVQLNLGMQLHFGAL